MVLLSKDFLFNKSITYFLKLVQRKKKKFFLLITILFLTTITSVLGGSGTLVVSSSPSGGKVYLDGSYVGNTPLTLGGIPEGPHSITISKEGYEDASKSVEVIANTSNSVSLTLRQKPTFGAIKIYTTPSGASILFDGIPVGNSPLTLQDIPKGTHTIQATQKGYKEASQTVTVYPNQTTQVSLTLTAFAPPTSPPQKPPVVIVQPPKPPPPPPPTPIREAYLRVISEPDGALIYVNGNVKGRTPAQITLNAGSYTVEVSLDGYSASAKYITLDGGEAEKVVFTLTPLKPGKLTINSNPQGAELYFDGQLKGTTPCVLEEVSPSSHKIKLLKDGYKPKSFTVTPVSGKEKEITVNLIELPLQLEITSIPSGADLYINNKMKGKTPFKISGFSPGDYNIKIVKIGFRAKEQVIAIPSTEKKLEVKLEPSGGVVKVETEPEGAQVVLDGIEKGVSPISLTELTSGEHQLILKKEGYAPYTKNFTINLGEELPIKAILIPLTPIASLTSLPVNITSQPPEVETTPTPSQVAQLPAVISNLSKTLNTLPFPPYYLIIGIGMFLLTLILILSRKKPPVYRPPVTSIATAPPEIAKTTVIKPSTSKTVALKPTTFVKPAPVVKPPPKHPDIKPAPTSLPTTKLVPPAKPAASKGEIKEIGTYIILDKIGSSYWYTSYKAQNKLTEKIVSLHNMADELKKHPEFVKEFLKEAENWRTLSHPNIVTFYEGGVDQSGNLYICTELLEGETLENILKSKIYLSLEEIIDMMQKIMVVLSYINLKGQIHGDLRPENILILDKQRIKVNNLCIFKNLYKFMIENIGVYKGEILYTSPEKLKRELLDIRADIFSAGVILYRLTTGNFPFTGDTPNSLINSIQAFQTPLPSNFNKNIPEELDKLIIKMIDPDRLKRYRSPDLLIGILRGLKLKIQFGRNI